MLHSSQRFSAEVQASIRQHLENLIAETPGVVLSVLTSGDGMEIAAHPQPSSTTQRVAAMSSSLQALSQAIVTEAGLHNSRNLIIESETGTIVVLGVPNITPPVSLAVVASSGETTVGRILWASRNCCSLLERSLQHC
jgi:predicted regulator of Ras-like GTPase activity (Roadblock/LC7/MglB family)